MSATFINMNVSDVPELMSGFNLIIFCSYADEDIKKLTLEHAEAFADTYLGNVVNKVLVCSKTASGDRMEPKVRPFFGLEPGFYEHKCELTMQQGSFSCDGCRKKGFTEMWNCKPCDFGYCCDCMTKSKTPSSEQDKAPIMCLYDFSKMSCFFPKKEHARVSVDNINTMIKNYEAGELATTEMSMHELS